MKYWVKVLALAVVLGGLGTAHAQSSDSGSSSGSGSQSGGALGIDTTPGPVTVDSLNALLNGQVTANVNNLQGALLQGSNAGTTIPPVDPYVRDSNGNIVYDASGNPVKKSADQIAKEEADRQALIDAQNKATAVTNAAAAANLASSSQPSVTFNGVVITDEMANDGKVADPGTTFSTNETSTANNVPASDYESSNGDIQTAQGEGAWRSDGATGLMVDKGSGTVQIDPVAGDAGIQAIQNMLGGGPGVPVVGDPSNPTILSLPPVCKCCGAPLHEEKVIDGYNTVYTNGYGQLVVQDVNDGFWSQECNTWVPTMVGSTVDHVWFGPGTDPGFSGGGDVIDTGCRDYLAQTFNWSPANNSFRMVTDPVEISTHNLPPLNDGWSYYCYYVRADEPIYVTAKVCANGHRQDKPCPVQ